MSIMHDAVMDDVEPKLIDRMIEISGIKSSDQVTIASGGIEFLIDLLHRGITQASCVVPGCALSAEDTDILLIPDTASLPAFAAMLDRVGRHLHAGGTAILYDAGTGQWQRRQQIRRILAEHGLIPIGETQCGHGTLLSARKLAAARLQSAA
jgi:hypothetical protein